MRKKQVGSKAATSANAFDTPDGPGDAKRSTKPSKKRKHQSVAGQPLLHAVGTASFCVRGPIQPK